MKIYENGIKYTITSTDGSCDIVTLPKSIVQNCSMTAEGFEELFFVFLKENVTHTAAYEKAEQVHEQYFERRRYSSYESFKQIQYRKK